MTPDPRFSRMTEHSYNRRVCTPAPKSSYFKNFHLPAMEWARKRAREPINVLDVACGNGSQSMFFREYGVVRTLVGVDISKPMLGTAKDRNPEYGFVAADVSAMPIRNNTFHLAIAVNAMIYKPDAMLFAMFDALAPGGIAVMNFRLAEKAENARFFEYASHKAQTVEVQFDAGGMKFRLYGIDDTRISGPGSIQSYFYDTEHVLQFVRAVSRQRQESGKGGIAVAVVSECTFWHRVGDEEILNHNIVVFAQKPTRADGMADESLKRHLVDRISTD